ncbi:adenylyl-sulfate kinase [bacterium]|nr:adenylyl-sulfate kinase [bacterium]
MHERRPTIKSRHITWTESYVSHVERTARNGHRGAVVWFTGLSGSGKSTLSKLVEQELFARECHVYVLDGDNMRHGLNRDLGFSPEDRAENIRRVGEVANLLRDSGAICLTAFISPYRDDRARARALCGEHPFIEVYCQCDLAECERRDPRGLYRKARAGEIRQFTGISAPYEEPEDPELVLRTDRWPPHDCVERVIDTLAERGVLASPGGPETLPRGA